jgi:hypothetical protein
VILVHLCRLFKRSKTVFLTTVSVGILVMVLFGAPLLLIRPAFAAPGDILTPKWNRTGLGSNSEAGMVIGDVTGDGKEDIVVGAGGISSPNYLYVLSGTDGSTIASYYNTRLGVYCQPQLYDVDNDGILEILCPLYNRAGLAVLKYDGTSTLNALWVRDVQGSNGSGSVMSKPVAGDINGDGWLEIYQASADVAPAGGYDGTVTMFDHLGNILHQTFCWRSCSGGLSLADTDNDGVFELYMGDRQMGYTDGGYGKGVRSFWADNLTERWNRLDFLSSSQAPVLADVNNDGITDVLSGMYREMNILNSTNGQEIQRWSDNTMSVHYQFTVYDIDGDGHLEMLCSDGEHDNDPYVDVYDLVTGELKAELSLLGGDEKFSPIVADISPSNPGMEIICAPNGTSLEGGTAWYGDILIYNSNYQLIQNVTRGYNNAHLTYDQVCSVQDIDGDGLLEVVVHGYPGNVYAFDTAAPAPGHNEALLPDSERIRSEVTNFGESRLGVAEHTIMPGEPDYWTAPLVGPVSPIDNSLAVPVSTDHLSFRLREDQSEPITYTVTTSPHIGSDSGLNSSNSYNWSTYTLDFTDPLDYDTTYKWTVSATDGVNSTVRTYSFRTELAPNIGNNAPTQGTPSLISQDGRNTTASTFECSNRSTADLDGDQVTNIYRWLVNGNPAANLLLPFDTRNETMTKDYSGYGNNGVVEGAVWTENGIVGGAYSFDGKDDAIIISDGGAGYFNDHPASSNNPELGGDGTWQEITVEAWIYPTAYNYGSRIVAKIPSYELGFASGYSNRLIASVWPVMGQIESAANNASTDRIQSVTYNVPNFQLDTWYHIAFTYKNGTGLKLYLNGVLVAQNTNVNKGPIKNSLGEPLYIGRLVQPFQGSIDEVRIYPYAQPAEQIYNRYQETKDGLSSSSLFYPQGIANPGDTLQCQVIPSDSYLDGSPSSVSKTLVNSPPIASDLSVSPVRDRDARLDGENLGTVYTYFDYDDQAESGSRISWFRNGVNQTALYGQFTVPAASTQIGDQWYFRVIPRDSGGALGDPQVSPTVTIRGNSAPVTGSPTLDSMNGGVDYDDEDLVCTAAATTDANGDATTNIFHWINGSVSQTNLQMPFDTEVPSIPHTNGVVKDYSGYGNNGAANGSSWVQNGVVGGALSFDGNDFVTVQEHSNSLGGDGSWSQITVEFWIRATGETTGTETVVFKPDSSYAPGASSYDIGYRAQYRYYTDNYRVYWIIYNSTGQYSLNVRVYENSTDWHHIVCTYQSGVGLKIYTDGTLRASMAGSGTIRATTGGLLYLGGINSGQGDFMGQMDEVRIYPKALSAAQVFQRYLETKDGLSASSTIVAQETAAGDNWVCQVIPNDSWQDGTARNSSSLHVDAVSGNSRPRIDWYSPADSAPSVDEGFGLDFMQESSDPDGNTLAYSWTLDAVEQATTQNWTYTPDYNSQGTHTVRFTVSDGSLTDFQQWTVHVIDVSLEFRNLTILAAINGTTNPGPGTYQYGLGTDASVQAMPDAGYVLDHWLLNGSDIGWQDPCIITMNDSYELQPVFIEAHYILTVNIVGSGLVVKIPDQPTYSYGDNVQLNAGPDEGCAFAGWSGDASGTDLSIFVNMTRDKEITATFVPLYEVVITVDGEGSTDPAPGTYEYPQGTDVQVHALPNTGYTLSHWLLDSVDAGSADPYTLTVDNGHVLTAVFVESWLFSDGFEYGDLTAWNGSTHTSGEAIAVVDSISHCGSYSAQFTTNGQGGTERAYVFSNIGGVDVYVRAYFNIGDGLPLGSADNRFNLFAFNVGTSTIASFGVRSTGTLDVWYINSNVGTWSASSGASMDRWYCVEAYVHVASSGGVLALWIDGNSVLEQTGLNTATLGSAVTSVRGGLVFVSGVTHNVALYGDCFVISTDYVGLESVQYELIIGANGGGSASPVPGTYMYDEGLGVEVTALPDAYMRLDYWLLDYVNVGGVNPYLVTMDTNHNLTAVFTNIQYDLIVQAGSGGTTDPVPNTHSEVAGTNVQVEAIPDADMKLDYWLLDDVNIGDTNPYTVFMDANHNLTAVFVHIQYELIIKAGSGGTTNPVPDTYMEDAGSSVEVEALPDANMKLNYWLLDDVSVGDTVPYSVFMDGSHNLTAVFTNVQYELTVTAGSGGITDPAPGIYMENAGSNVEVNAIPDADMKLDYWLLDSVNVGDANPYSVPINGNHSLVAMFAPLSGGGGGGGRIVVQGAHDEIYYRLYNSKNASWGDWLVTPDGATPDSPAAAVYSGRLYLVVRGMDNQTLWFGSVNLTDYSFSDWQALSGATPSAPTLTVYGSKLILVVRGFTNIIWYRYYDTAAMNWGDWIPVPNGATCDTPAAAVLGTNLHIVVRGFSTLDVGGNNTLWHGIVNLLNDSFSGWTSLPGATPSAPTLAASETLGRLYLSVRGMSDVIWINMWNGSTWEGWNPLPDGATIDSPAITVINGELHIVVRDITGNALWHYYIDLNTDTPSGWIPLDGYTPSAPTLTS